MKSFFFRLKGLKSSNLNRHVIELCYGLLHAYWSIMK